MTTEKQKGRHMFPSEKQRQYSGKYIQLDWQIARKFGRTHAESPQCMVPRCRAFTEAKTCHEAQIANWWIESTAYSSLGAEVGYGVSRPQTDVKHRKRI